LGKSYSLTLAASSLSTTYIVYEIPTKHATLANLPFPIIEHALETASLMLGAKKSRGYCFEMICADFLAGASLEHANSRSLIDSVLRLIALLPQSQRCDLLGALSAEK
jgi:hypothetical protein